MPVAKRVSAAVILLVAVGLLAYYGLPYLMHTTAPHPVADPKSVVKDCIQAIAEFYDDNGEVWPFGAEGSDGSCTEFIEVLTAPTVREAHSRLSGRGVALQLGRFGQYGFPYLRSQALDRTHEEYGPHAYALRWSAKERGAITYTVSVELDGATIAFDAQLEAAPTRSGSD